MGAMIQALSQAFLAGDIWMYAILATQIVSVAIMVERAMALYGLRKANQKSIVRKFEADIKKGALESALNNARRISFLNPIGAVIQAGVQGALDFGGREEIQARMDEVLLTENSRIEKRTGFLAMLANVGTLLGLLGTIVGLIQAFASVSNVNPAQKAALLTHGVSVAMNSTAYGLIVAIPALVVYAVLSNRINQLTDDLNQAALKVFNWLSFSYEAVPRAPVRTRKKQA